MNYTALINIPELKGESSLEAWNEGLLTSLNLARIRRYIEEDIPEPDPFEIRERDQWAKDRALAVYPITSSTYAVRSILRNSGWDKKEENPKVLYDLINTTIPQLTQESIMVLVKQANTIKRQDFTSLSAFLD